MSEHVLEYPWTFSYKPRVAYKQQSERDWLSDYKTIYEIKSVEKFWSVYNNLPCFTDMPHGSIYAFFRNSIHPSWEHPDNKKGFSWIIYVNKYTDKEWVKKVYECSLLTLIGSVYKYESMLNGSTFEKKARGDKIGFWFKHDDAIHDIEYTQVLQELLDYIEVDKDDYLVCEDVTKVDWKSPEFKNIKAVIKLIHHDSSASHKGNNNNNNNNGTYTKK